MKSIPDEDYNGYTASLEELRSHKYKERVTRENRNHSYAKFAATKEECSTVIGQNIDKAWIISEAERLADGISQIVPDSADILKAQLRNLEEHQLVSILCTCVFYLVDYNPALL